MTEVSFEDYSNLRTVIQTARKLLLLEDEISLFDEINRIVCDELGFSASVIFVKEGDIFRTVSRYSSDPETMNGEIANHIMPAKVVDEIRNHAEPIGNLFWLDGRTEVIQNSIQSFIVPTPNFDESKSGWHPLSLLFAPLYDRDGELIGLINPDDPKDGTLPSAENSLFLELFANYCSIAIELLRARTNAASRIRILEAQRAQISRLFETTAESRRQEQLNEVLSDFARMMAEAADFQRIVINLKEPDTSRLQLRASYGLTKAEEEALAINATDLRQFEPLMQPEMAIGGVYFFDHKRFSLPDEVWEMLAVPERTAHEGDDIWHPLDSLTIPLFDFDGDEIGIISLDEPISGRHPTASQLETLEFFSSQCEAAISQVIKFQRLERKAQTDDLTHLPTRNFFTLQVDHTIERAIQSGQKISVLFLDIDKFKHINDTYGHLAGDRYLIACADIIESFAPDGTIVARYGGEEFTLLLNDLDEEGAIAEAEKIRGSIESMSIDASEGGEIRSTISIGVATFDPSLHRHRFRSLATSDLTVALLGAADKALYKAKESGRNRVATSSFEP
ncbi:MAG: GGDEF domain-containing protein [Actinomycetota bacterium]|nr:GGDEF domain-containing protein [Actinomycetota bacterium]